MCLRITSGALLSKRAPSTTRPSLPFRINDLRLCVNWDSVDCDKSFKCGAITYGLFQDRPPLRIQEHCWRASDAQRLDDAVSAAGRWRRLGNKKKPGNGGTKHPDPDQCAACETRSVWHFRHEGETDAVDRRPRQQPDHIRDQRSVNGDDDGLIALVQFPTRKLSGTMPSFTTDAGAGRGRRALDDPRSTPLRPSLRAGDRARRTATISCWMNSPYWTPASKPARPGRASFRPC